MQAIPARASVSVEAARQLGPLIQSYAAEIEATRELPRALFEALADAGLFHMVVHRAAGGDEIDFPTYLDIIEEVGKADASVAWCVNQAASFATYAPCMPLDVATRIFQGRGVVGNTPAATGTAVVVPGGYRVTGKHGFGTGCRHASWMASRAQVVEDGVPRLRADGSPEIRYLMLPAQDAQILDTWDVRGLRGTGTHHWTVDDVFVREEYTFSPDDSPGPAYAPIYRIPRQILAACGDAATALGVARSCLDLFVELAKTKQAANTGSLLREEALVQFDVGHAEADLRSSRAFLRETVRELWAEIAATNAITLEQKALLRLASVHAIRLSAGVVDAMYNAAGATAVQKSHPIQRHFQDIHVITQHMQSRRSHYELVGKVLLGMEPRSSFL